MTDDKKTPFDTDEKDDTPLGDTDEHSDAETQGVPDGDED